MLPKFITLVSLILMSSLILNPIHFSAFYFIFRPLVQPYAIDKLTLFAGIPLTSVYPLLVIFYSNYICFLKKSYSFIVPNILPMYGLLYFSILSFFNTLDYMTSFAHLLKLTTAISLYCLLYNAVKSEETAKKVLLALVVSSLIPMLYGYFQYITGTGGADVPGAPPRVSSFFGWNEYGIFLCITMSATLILLFHEKKQLNKVLLLGLLASMVVSSILAKNRGSWITYTSALIVSYLPYRNKIKIKWFVIAGFIIAIVFGDMIVTRFSQLLETTSWGMSTNTLAMRVSFWKKVASLLYLHPFTGLGIGTSGLLFQEHFDMFVFPHNDYLTLLIETGIAGALLYIIFLGTILLHNIKLTRNKTIWYVNYPMLVLILYWIILANTQNMIYDMVIFPMFMSILAVTQKWNMLLSLKGSGFVEKER